MYHEFFGLNQAPFKITPDTSLFFGGGSRGEILNGLVYAIESGEGIVKVVGEVGSGKTMLCRMLELRLSRSVEIVYLANPSLSPEEILHAIALEMSIPVAPDANRLQVMHALQQALLEKHSANTRVVVFVEEAQSMPLGTLEEIRLLSNLETQRDKLLQIVLFGQPELDRNLDERSIRQLRERITHSFVLAPLDTAQVREYLSYRLRAAGYRGPDLFSPAAARSAAKASAGLIRRINILADKALLAAFAQNSHGVARRHVAAAIRDSEFGERRPSFARRAAIAGAGAAVVAGAFAWHFAIEVKPQGAGVSVADSNPTAQEHVPPSGQALAAPRRAEAPAESAAPTENPPLAVGSGSVARAAQAAAQPVPDAPSGEGGAGDGPESPSTGGAALSPARAEVPLAKIARTAGNGSRREIVETASLAMLPEPEGDLPQATDSRATEAHATRSTPRVPSGDLSERPAGAEPSALRRAARNSENDSTKMNELIDPQSMLGRRVAAAAEWFADVDRERLSVQLLAAHWSEWRGLEATLSTWKGVVPLDKVFVYPTIIDGNMWFGVLYGDFETLTAARRAIDELPARMKRRAPFVRNIKDIRPIAPNAVSAVWGAIG